MSQIAGSGRIIDCPRPATALGDAHRRAMPTEELRPVADLPGAIRDGKASPASAELGLPELKTQ